MPRKRSKPAPIPRQLQPNAIRIAYFSDLDVYVAEMTGLVERGLIPTLTDLLADTHKLDATPEQTEAKKRADRIINHLSEEMVQKMRPKELEALAEKYADRTSKFQKAQFARQADAVGVNLSVIKKVDKGVDKQLDGWAAINVDLIKTMPKEYFDDVRLHVYEAIEKGTRHETLAATLQERYEIPANRALLIARDQVGKLYGNLNQIRQSNLGIEGYTWRITNDNRVRPEHESREGVKFTWADPPAGGHPGEDIQCRCYPEPDFTEILS